MEEVIFTIFFLDAEERAPTKVKMPVKTGCPPFFPERSAFTHTSSRVFSNCLGVDKTTQV